MNSSRRMYLLLALWAFYAVITTERLPTANAHNPELSNLIPVERVQNRSSSCPVSLCFGIDGGRLTRTQVRRQRNFFGALLKLLSRKDGVKVAAVEYGSVNRRLFALTSNFSEAASVAANLTFRGDELSSVSSSIVYCDSVLRDEEDRQARMVLFSDGTDNLGGSPSRRAEVFRTRSEGDIIVISLANSNSEVFKQVTSNNSRDIFSLESDRYDSLLREVADRVCQ